MTIRNVSFIIASGCGGIISWLLMFHLVAKFIVGGNTKTCVVAGYPEPDAPAPERVNFLNFFDIRAGAAGFFSPRLFRSDTVGLSFVCFRGTHLDATIATCSGNRDAWVGC
ncbi:hypothetical protein [Salmonella enterica]|uniref:hypothetical protein n=1 Tax=Salmonella enterica TaxID=28901 RepID=UPI0012B6889B|nr:hypothetical protein [Salmonella enterica]